MKGTKGTTDGSTLIGALNASSVPTALNIDGSGNLKTSATISNGNPNGQATMANSSPVVLPSDQIVNVQGGTAKFASAPGNALLTGMQALSDNLQPLYSSSRAGGNGTAVDDDKLLSIALALRGTPGSTFMRTPDTFKTASATASGDTAVWTPTSGKKFRLMRYKIEVTQNVAAASGAVLSIILRDATTGLACTHSVFIPAAAATTFGPGWSSEWIDLGNGILSAAANNVLNVNLSFALTAGNVRVITAGTEE